MMKITSYNMAQSTHRKYHKTQREVKQASLFRVKSQPKRSVTFNDYMSKLEDYQKIVEAQLQANIELIEALLAYLSGRKFEFYDVVHDKKETPHKYVLRLSAETETYESEEMTFSANGLIKTSDGNTIDFSYDLKMSREYYEKNTSELEVGRQMLDPLVLNLDNKGANFSNQKIHIDLDLDGKIDTFNMLTRGSGFLALDKNGNGIVDDGSELFGPKTNNGFGELKAYDFDGNHWIDENDDIFKSLKIWTLNKEGSKTLIGLKEAGIGAIYLDGIEGKFEFKDDKDVIAKLTNSSIFLRDDGTPGSVHEIKL